MKKAFIFLLLINGILGSVNAQSKKIFLKFSNPVITGNSTQIGYTDFFEIEDFKYNQKVVDGNSTSGILTFEMQTNAKSPEIWLLHANATTPITFEVRFAETNPTVNEICIYKFKNAYINSISNSSTAKIIKYSFYVGAYHLQYNTTVGGSPVSIGRDYILNQPWNGL